MKDKKKSKPYFQLFGPILWVNIYILVAEILTKYCFTQEHSKSKTIIKMQVSLPIEWILESEGLFQRIYHA